MVYVCKVVIWVISFEKGDLFFLLFIFIFKYLMSKTWEVFTQSSEPEAHVKNARQTKKYKTG